jgi:hypothetical protein
VTRLRSQQDGDDLELAEMDAPPAIDKCKGKWVVREGDEDEGVVKSADPVSRVMKVLYEVDGSDEMDVVDVPYDEEGLVWLEAMSKPPPAVVSPGDADDADDHVEEEAAATRIQALFRGR